jgi:hypothetical protein
MARYAWLSAALLAAAVASPANAQAVISEPGYCAQFYPNANCQNKGPGNPYTDPNYRRNYGGGYWQNNNAQMIEPQALEPGVNAHRHRHHRAHRHQY